MGEKIGNSAILFGILLVTAAIGIMYFGEMTDAPGGVNTIAMLFLMVGIVIGVVGGLSAFRK